MTKMKTTKKSLLISALSLLLCFAMLIGTTFAWFTDSVTSANNIIVSGNLDIELEYAAVIENGEVKEWKTVQNASDILTNNLWEPGVTEVAYLRLKNAGSLALKYQLGVNIVSEKSGTNVAGDTFLLSDYIYFDVIESTTETIYATREDAMAKATETILISDGFQKAGTLEGKSAYTYFNMVVYMPTTVDNKANHNGEDIPEINLGITVFATQVSSEEDSFGSDYDYGAPIQTAPESVPAAGKDFVLNASLDSGVQVTIPATVMNAISDEVTSMSVVASAPAIDAENKTVSFDSVELLDQDGNKVDLSESTAKVVVTLPVGDAFEAGEQVEVYHDGSFVTYATVKHDDEKEANYISYEVSHFCEVEIKAAEEVVLDNTIDSVKEFIAFAEAVNAGKNYAGETVVLGADLNLNGVTWTPIGTSANPFKGTFDGNGKVIKNLSVLMAGKSNVGLFGFTTDGEIKNVTVENAKVAGRLNVGVVAGTPYTSKYTNVTVMGHVEVDGMAYVGGVAGKNAYANWNNITVNVDADSYVNAYSIENGTAYRTYVGGVVGFNGEGGHSFTNITSNINVIGSTCDVGGAFGIAHYGNKFENVTVTGNVTITKAEEAAEADEIGGIAGVWHNESGYAVTFTNCTFTGKLTTNVEATLNNNTITGDAYSKTGNGTLVIDGKTYAAVNTGDELVAALENKNSVIFVDNIKIEPAKMSNAYGATGVNVKYGQTIDGNDYTLNIKGAGGTWDSGINTTGGVIKNLTVTGSFRGIFINHTSDYSEKVVLENVVIGGNGTVYTISCDQGLYQGIEATNCTFNGWTSFAKTAGEAKFVNCNFGEGSGYKYCRPYSNTQFVGCTFSEGYAVDTTRATVTFDDNCVYKVNSAAALETAVKNGATKLFLAPGEYNIANCGGKTLTISGTKDAVLKIMNEGEGGCDYGFDGSNVTFNGVTIDTTANTGSYKGYARMTATFNDCAFVGGGYTTFSASSFNNCTFDLNGYIWTWGATEVNFTECTFIGDSRTILAHGSASTVITIKDCDFAATTKGHTGAGDWTAAVEIDPAGSNAYTINFIGENTLSENYSGWTRVKDGSTGHVITGLN